MAFDTLDTAEETIQEPSFEMKDGKLVDTTQYEEDNSSEAEESAPEAEEQNTDNQEEAQPEATSETDEEENEVETESPEDSTATEEPEEEDDEAFYQSLSEEVGFEIKSEEDITQALKELSELKNSNPLTQDEELRAFYEFKQSGGDTAQFHALKSKNFESMDSKDLLKEQFLLNNKDLAKENPKLAESKFQREMRNKYNLLNTDLESMDEDEREEWEAENKEEFETQKMEFEYETEQAKKSLTDWQQKATSPQSQEPEMTAEQAQQIQQEWESTLKQATDSFDGFDIKVGDGVDDFKLGIAPDELQSISEEIKDPGNFIAQLTGFDAETGKVDANKLMEVAAKLKKFDQLGSLMSDYILEQRNLETVESEVTNPSNPERSNPAKVPQTERERWLAAKKVSNF